MKRTIMAIIAALAIMIGAPGAVSAQSLGIPTDANFKVAFLADTGNGTGFSSVLNLIKSEGAQAVVHQGDFDYSYNAKAFFGKIDSVLGPNFPYFASVGNHDDASWNDNCSDPDGCYSTFLKDRMTRIGVTPDNPDLNDQMYSAVFKGLKLVFAGQNGGSGDSVYAPYIQTQLAGDNHIWKVCSWHKNMNYMQLGTKGNEMGWGVYERCREAGAIIATGHEHTYERTKTLTDIDTLTVDAAQHPKDGQGVPQNPDSLIVSPGRTFVLVTGLGGNGMRNQDRCLPTTYPYGGGLGCNYIWAKAYTTDQGSVHGAVFITFNAGGNPNKAVGYFKNINGQVVDQFEITRSAVPVVGSSLSPIPTRTPTISKSPTPTISKSPTPTISKAPQQSPTATSKPTDSSTPKPSKTPKPTMVPAPTGSGKAKRADANRDGKVNEADYAIWKQNNGKQLTGGVSVGDFNGDGLVDGVDYVIWMNRVSNVFGNANDKGDDDDDDKKDQPRNKSNKSDDDDDEGEKDD